MLLSYILGRSATGEQEAADHSRRGSGEDNGPVLPQARSGGASSRGASVGSLCGLDDSVCWLRPACCLGRCPVRPH